MQEACWCCGAESQLLDAGSVVILNVCRRSCLLRAATYFSKELDALLQPCDLRMNDNLPPSRAEDCGMRLLRNS